VREVAPPDNPPDGAVVLEIDPASGELATPACTGTITEFFIKGTEPTKVCHLHYRGEPEKLAAAPAVPAPAAEPEHVAALPTEPAPIPSAVAATPVPPVTVPTKPLPPAQPAEPPKKKGFWGRIFGGG
jgi:hypothetical protein